MRRQPKKVIKAPSIQIDGFRNLGAWAQRGTCAARRRTTRRRRCVVARYPGVVRRPCAPREEEETTTSALTVRTLHNDRAATTEWLRS